jgi:hypothetical protein
MNLYFFVLYDCYKIWFGKHEIVKQNNSDSINLWWIAVNIHKTFIKYDIFFHPKINNYIKQKKNLKSSYKEEVINNWPAQLKKTL